MAERLGLVRLLDHRVLDLVGGEMVAAPALRASVNVSPASTVDPDWWAALGACCAPMRASPSGSPSRSPRRRRSRTSTTPAASSPASRISGCRIAIDDFGAGYTSFRNLRKLGVDIVKIDGAFVQNSVQSEDDRAFVHTLIDLARRLGLETVAEWVQDEEAGHDAGRVGLRLSAGRADRARIAGPAWEGAGVAPRRAWALPDCVEPESALLLECIAF